MYSSVGGYDCSCMNGPTRFLGTRGAPCDVIDQAALELWIAEQGSQVSLRKGNVIEPGNPSSRSIYRVLEGAIRLSALAADGRRQVMRFVFPRMFFCVVPAERMLSAEAVTDAILLRYSVEAVEKFAGCNPQIALQMLGAARESSAATLELLFLRGRKDPIERIALFLKITHRYLGVGDVIDLPMSRVDIADFVGLTVETVSRAFSSLRRLNAIESISRSVIQVDLKRLTSLVEKTAIK